MTIHEMMHQVALLSTGHYERRGDVSTIEIPTPGERRQVIFGKTDEIGEDVIAVLYTTVGSSSDCPDMQYLLQLNTVLRHCRTALLEDGSIVLIAMFDLLSASVKECARVIQELAAVADDLEKRWFDSDTA
jgi:hypothetical protein